MKKVWSISTTLRNPERIRNFLIAVKEIEGEIWNKETQKKFQIILIQKKFYGAGSSLFYKNLSEGQINLMESPEEISFEEAEDILETKHYKGGGDMRGRNSFKPVEKMGLAAIDNDKKIKITSLGEYLLGENYDLGEMFFKSFLKWQYPNPASINFKESDGYSIKPFVATLHLINKVNSLCRSKKEKEKGISVIEFRIFVPTLINFNEIENQAELLMKFRNKLEKIKKEQERKKFINEFISKYFGDFENASYHNLGEYTDNIIRYFRSTRYLYIRGSGFYIDTEPRRKIEIDKLLESDDAHSIDLNLAEYNAYISDINQPILPWETDRELNEILDLTKEDLSEYEKNLADKGVKVVKYKFKDFNKLSTNLKKQYLSDLREHRRMLKGLEDHFVSQNIENIKQYIEGLNNIHNSEIKKSIKLEWLASLALNALNDAILIKPNYPVGDDNEPTFTAPANKPDIECFYEKFNSVCEVTLLTNRAQWYNEGQPVMRHVRDFEEKNSDKITYCLFIAPKIHRDTINTFWYAVKHEYEGKKQKIIPLSLKQFINLLEILIKIKEQGKQLSHQQLSVLYDEILRPVDKLNNSGEWLQEIPEKIKKWETQVLSKS